MRSWDLAGKARAALLPLLFLLLATLALGGCQHSITPPAMVSDPVRVFVTFNADGTAIITTPQGTTVPGTWSAANNMLCLSANGAQECWPYTQPFQAGQQIALTSSCQQVSTFLAQATNPPAQQPAGQRG